MGICDKISKVFGPYHKVGTNTYLAVRAHGERITGRLAVVGACGCNFGKYTTARPTRLASPGELMESSETIVATGSVSVPFQLVGPVTVIFAGIWTSTDTPFEVALEVAALVNVPDSVPLPLSLVATESDEPETDTSRIFAEWLPAASVAV